MLLAGAVAFASFTIYVLCQTHEWIGVPDEPAERWYPVDRFAPGTCRCSDESVLNENVLIKNPTIENSLNLVVLFPMQTTF